MPLEPDRPVDAPTLGGLLICARIMVGVTMATSSHL